MADQDARVEIGRVEAGVAELLRKPPPCGGDGERGVGCDGRHHDDSAASSSA